MAQSDLSGTPIEPDAKAEVTVRLADGRARRLTLTAAEADKFAGMGQPVGGVIGAFVIRNWRSFSWWAFGILIVSLLVPAATKQWADGQSALTLKSSLNLEMSKSAGSAVPAAQKVTEAANEDQARKAQRDAVNAWRMAQSGIDPVLALYFPNTGAAKMWGWYQQVIEAYIFLPCCGDRQNIINFIREYFERYSERYSEPEWSSLDHSKTTDSEFRRAYYDLGQSLLQQQQTVLLNELLRTPAEGYSSGLGDFWRDVIPGW